MAQRSPGIGTSSRSPASDSGGDGPGTIVWNFPARGASPTTSPVKITETEQVQWAARQDPERKSLPNSPRVEKDPPAPQPESGTSSIRPVFMLDIEQFKQSVGQKEDLIVVLDRNGRPVSPESNNIDSGEPAANDEIPEVGMPNTDELDSGGTTDSSCLGILASNDNSIRNNSDAVEVVNSTHLPGVTIKKEFKCSTCGEMFTSENTLELHKLKHLMKQGPDVGSFGEKLKALAAIASGQSEEASPEGPTDDDEGCGVILCSRCPDIFSSRQEYLTHCRVVHKFDPDGGNDFPAESLSAASVEATRKSRETHASPHFVDITPAPATANMNNHSIPSPRALSPGSSKSPVGTQYQPGSPSSRPSLSKSLKMPNVCGDCGYSFKTYIELKRHRAGNIVHPCPKCTKILPRKDHYLKHCKTFHSSDIAAGWNPENPLPMMRTTAPACNSMKRAMSAKKKSKGFLDFIPDGQSSPGPAGPGSTPPRMPLSGLGPEAFSLRRPVKPPVDRRNVSVVGTVQVEATSENESDIDVEGTSEHGDGVTVKCEEEDMSLTIGEVTGHYWGHDPEDINKSHSPEAGMSMSPDSSKSRRKTSKPRRYFDDTFLNFDMEDPNNGAMSNVADANDTSPLVSPNASAAPPSGESTTTNAETWVHQESEDQTGKFNLRKIYTCEDCGQHFQSKQYYRSHRRDASVMCNQCKKILTRIGNYVNHCKTAHKDALDAGWDPLKPPPRKVKMLPICILQIKRRRNQGLKKNILPRQGKGTASAYKPFGSALASPHPSMTVFPTPEVKHVPLPPMSIKSEPMESGFQNRPIPPPIARPLLSASSQTFRRAPTSMKTKRKYSRKAKYYPDVIRHPLPCCEHCGKEFKKIEHLRRHSNIEKIVCPQCNRKIIRLDNYWTHCRAKHMDEMQDGWQPMNPPPKRIRAGPACLLPKFRLPKRQFDIKKGIRQMLRRPSMVDSQARLIPFEETKQEEIEIPQEPVKPHLPKSELNVTGKGDLQLHKGSDLQTHKGSDLQPRVVIEGCKCPACGIVLLSEELLKAHIAKHDENDFTEKVELHKTSSEREMDTARPEQPKEILRKEPGRSKTGLLPYKVNFKGMRMRFECRDCHKSFTKLLTLRRHRGDFAVGCSKCGKIILRKDLYLYHCKSVHKSDIAQGWDPFRPAPKRIQIVPPCISKQEGMEDMVKEELQESDDDTIVNGTESDVSSLAAVSEMGNSESPISFSKELKDTCGESKGMTEESKTFESGSLVSASPSSPAPDTEHPGKKVKCRYCSKEFQSRSILFNHQRRDLIVCPFCPKNFMQMAEYMRHCQSGHRAEIEAGWKPDCPIPKRIWLRLPPCASNAAKSSPYSIRTGKSPNAVESANTDSDEKSAIADVENGPESLSKEVPEVAPKEELYEEESAEPPPDALGGQMFMSNFYRKHQCKFCLQIFKKSNVLKRHLRRDVIPCPLCHKKFLLKTDYIVHCRAQHQFQISEGWDPEKPTPKRLWLKFPPCLSHKVSSKIHYGRKTKRRGYLHTGASKGSGKGNNFGQPATFANSIGSSESMFGDGLNNQELQENNCEMKEHTNNLVSSDRSTYSQQAVRSSSFNPPECQETFPQKALEIQNKVISHLQTENRELKEKYDLLQAVLLRQDALLQELRDEVFKLKTSKLKNDVVFHNIPVDSEKPERVPEERIHTLLYEQNLSKNIKLESVRFLSKHSALNGVTSSKNLPVVARFQSPADAKCVLEGMKAVQGPDKVKVTRNYSAAECSRRRVLRGVARAAKKDASAENPVRTRLAGTTLYINDKPYEDPIPAQTARELLCPKESELECIELGQFHSSRVEIVNGKSLKACAVHVTSLTEVLVAYRKFVSGSGLPGACYCPMAYRLSAIEPVEEGSINVNKHNEQTAGHVNDGLLTAGVHLEKILERKNCLGVMVVVLSQSKVPLCDTTLLDGLAEEAINKCLV